jgi:NitT/TauT family transport system ATP-binding protein
MSIALHRVTKAFPLKQPGKSVRVLEGMDLTIADSSITSLFGPNGCGKTTILNIIAGIESHDGGTVTVDSNGAERPLIGYAFQNFHEVLLPWKTAIDNLAFGLRASGVPREQATQASQSFLEAYEFGFPHDRYPYQMSVGQQQALALARTLIQSPANVLLDEPFVALDHEARFRMQDVVTTVLNQKPTAIAFISHDIDEALYMSDELLLLSKRPARIIRRFSIPFNRPRHHELLTSYEFANIRREVVAAFLNEVGV